jgi:hypothetical protein
LHNIFFGNRGYGGIFTTASTTSCTLLQPSHKHCNAAGDS